MSQDSEAVDYSKSITVDRNPFSAANNYIKVKEMWDFLQRNNIKYNHGKDVFINDFSFKFNMDIFKVFIKRL